MLHLVSGDTSATIAPHRGAIVTSFRVGGRELLYLDQATFNDRSKNVRGGIPVLFPSPGKLANDRWSRAGKSGELRQHGFARNLEWRVESRSATAATLAIEASAETLAAYPWRFRLQVTYSVEPNALDITFTIANDDTTPMPFALGLHPYFLIDDKSAGRIPTPATRAFDNVAKRNITFAGFELADGEVDIHLLDHGSTTARLESRDGTIEITCSPELARWVVWTLPGKEFVCLEPWSAPADALNSGEGILLVAPGKRSTLSVRISA